MIALAVYVVSFFVTSVLITLCDPPRWRRSLRLLLGVIFLALSVMLSYYLGLGAISMQIKLDGLGKYLSIDILAMVNFVTVSLKETNLTQISTFPWSVVLLFTTVGLWLYALPRLAVAGARVFLRQLSPGETIASTPEGTVDADEEDIKAAAQDVATLDSAATPFLARRAEQFLSNASVKRILAMILVVLCALHVALPWEAHYLAVFTGLDLSHDLGVVVWVGGYVLMVEIYGAIPKTRPVSTLQPRILDKPGDLSDKSLQPLLSEYRQEFKNYILMDEKFRGSQRVDSAATEGGDQDKFVERTPSKFVEGDPITIGDRTIDSIGSRLMNDYDLAVPTTNALKFGLRELYQNETCLLFSETLTEAHFALFADLIQSCQDEGGVALLLCPDKRALAIEEALVQKFGLYYPNFVHRGCLLGRDAPVRALLFNFLIVPDSAFEVDFLENTDKFDKELRRVRLLLCLDLQDLDLSLLRLHLRRLFFSLPKWNIRVVCQAEGLPTLPTLVSNFLPKGQPGPASPIRLRPDTRKSWHALVWNDTPTTSRELASFYGGQYQPFLATLPLLMIPVWLRRISIFQFDPEMVRDSRLWHLLGNNWLPQLEQTRSISDRPLQQPAGCYVLKEHIAQVVCVEDRNNLALAFNRTYGFRRKADALLNICSRSYPLRDLLVRQLKTCQTLTMQERWLPVAPVPEAGITELVYLLNRELLQEDGLGRSKLREYLAFAPSRLLERMGIGANRPGLQNLYRKQFGSLAPNILRDFDEDNEEFYYIPKEDRRTTRLEFFFKVAGGPEKWVFRLPKTDEGLTYAAGTLIQLKGDDVGSTTGNFYMVESIREEKVNVRLSHYLDQGMLTRPVYVFARRYGLSFTNEDAAEEGEEVSRPVNPRLQVFTAHVHACFWRKSVGYYRLKDGELPFADVEPKFFDAVGERIKVNRRYKSVLHLHFVGQEIGQWREADNGRARLAFSLCVILQDVIETLFPFHAHRIAVVSDSAKLLYDKIDTAQEDSLDRFLKHRYSILCEVAGNPIDVWRQQSWQKSMTDDPSLNLFIIEDADHDLGVVRAIRDQLEEGIWLRCQEYCSWLVDDDASRSPYHNFGRAEAATILDFQAAKNFLDLMIKGRQSDVAQDETTAE